MRVRRGRFAGVRSRVELSFAVGGLLLSGVLGVVTMSVTSGYLYEQREASTVRQAVASRAQVEQGLGARNRPAEVIDRSRSPGSEALLLLGGSEFSSELGLSAADLPSELRERAGRGEPVQQRVRVDGEPVLVVALPLSATAGVYVEAFPLTELEEALRTLSLVLLGGVILTTLLGAAIGRWATTRTLRPLRVIADGAARVAGGDLATRLDGHGDPDLEPVTAAFNATTQNLQERLARDARFASDVSHELRSPITTMVNAMHVVDRHSDALPAPGRQALQLLQAELAGFATLVEDLLSVSRDADAEDLVLVEAPFADLVRRVAEPLAGHEVLWVAPDAASVLVCGDLRRLRRVVTNLIANAQLHGGGLRALRVEARPDDVRLTVADEGPGVPLDLRERVFERFFRGPASRAGARSSGLGLAIVAQDVRAHGGQVWVEDAPQGGACFVVQLPRAEEPA